MRLKHNNTHVRKSRFLKSRFELRLRQVIFLSFVQKDFFRCHNVKMRLFGPPPIAPQGLFCELPFRGRSPYLRGVVKKAFDPGHRPHVDINAAGAFSKIAEEPGHPPPHGVQRAYRTLCVHATSVCQLRSTVRSQDVLHAISRF